MNEGENRGLMFYTICDEVCTKINEKRYRLLTCIEGGVETELGLAFPVESSRGSTRFFRGNGCRTHLKVWMGSIYNVVVSVVRNGMDTSRLGFRIKKRNDSE